MALSFREHPTLGPLPVVRGPDLEGKPPQLLFTENETNHERLFKTPNTSPYVKDAFHEYVVHGRFASGQSGASRNQSRCPLRAENPAARERPRCRLRLFSDEESPRQAVRPRFRPIFADRISEADEFYRPPDAGRTLPDEDRQISRQAYAGLLVDQAVLSLHRPGLARRRPGSAAAARRAATRAAMPIGVTSTIATSSPCRTSGSTRGTRPGTWRFT